MTFMTRLTAMPHMTCMSLMTILPIMTMITMMPQHWGQHQACAPDNEKGPFGHDQQEQWQAQAAGCRQFA